MTSPNRDDTQPGTEKPSGFAVRHENHEALRKKVEGAVLDACLQYADTARAYTGERKAVHTSYILKDASDAILSALQSGGEA